MKNLDVILGLLRWMRNNALELMSAISFLGDEPRSGRVWAYPVMAQSMIVHHGMLPAFARHLRQWSSLTLPIIRIVVKHFGLFQLIGLLDLAVRSVTNLFTRLIV
jgi:hypothetical protein